MKQLSQDAQTTLLLTTHFGDKGPMEHGPLTPTEWGRFARWLTEQSIAPGELLVGNRRELLRGFQDNKISLERMETLINRGTTLALSVEKWSRAGLWIITRSDSAYPEKLTERLNHNCPPVLFGSGDNNLLNKPAIAAVGSRDVTNEDLKFSRTIGGKAAASGFAIVSGGARGVDEASMLGALEAEGTAIGVLADSLLKKSTSRIYRNHIQRKNIVLISPFSPEAGFNVGNAMARNKYIYCLSEAAVVVHSGRTGGTWSGATENLKKQWVPLWVKRTSDPDSGNNDLVNLGGSWLPHNIVEGDLNSLLGRKSTSNDEKDVKIDCIADQSNRSFYEIFLFKLKSLLKNDSMTRTELQDVFDLTPKQLDVWLRKAIESEQIIKKGTPVSYSLIQKAKGNQLAMFDES